MSYSTYGYYPSLTLVVNVAKYVDREHSLYQGGTSVGLQLYWIGLNRFTTYK